MDIYVSQAKMEQLLRIAFWISDLRSQFHQDKISGYFTIVNYRHILFLEEIKEKDLR